MKSGVVGATVLVVLTAVLTSIPAASASGGGYVRAYENVVNGNVADLTPQDVAVTSGGGVLALASTESPHAVLVNWLARLGRGGRALWSEEVGCLDLPPGDYTIAVAMDRTADGGSVLAGGTLGCGTSTFVQQALVEKIDPSGQVSWAQTYPAGVEGSALTQIRQTADGGYIAVGNATDGQGNTGGLVVRLDGSGAVKWQRTLGPSGSYQAYLNAVQQTSDGGFVAAGDLAEPGPNGLPRTSVLVADLDATGAVRWQHAFNSEDPSGSHTAWEQTRAILQTADGGFLVAGSWRNTQSQDQCCIGALVLKLDPTGHPQWQRAYSGGVYCDQGVCQNIGAFVYSMRQAPNGRYILAGDDDLEMVGGGAQIVPWLGEIDGNGKLDWQSLYFEVYAPTGRPLSEYFAAADPTSHNGAMAVGYTEDYPAQKGELYAVRTDRSGNVSGCADAHSAPATNVLDPALVEFGPSLAIGVAGLTGSSAPVTTLPTSIHVQHECS